MVLKIQSLSYKRQLLGESKFVILLQIICDPNQDVLIPFILVSAKLIILDAIFFKSSILVKVIFGVT